MGILTDIYNTVAKFFRSQEINNGEDPSKSVAQNRLKLVLMQDRTNLTPKVLEQMRGEMIDLLSKYLEMDKELLELNFEQEGDQVALMLSIPVIRAKDEEEIEAALAGVNEEENGDELDEDNSDEDTEDEELEKTEEESEVVAESETSEEASEEAPKPKKRRSKKVTAPEELEAKNEETECESQEFSENEELAENEIVCEHTEG